MKHIRVVLYPLLSILLALALGISLSGAQANAPSDQLQAALGYGFTYQGQLTDSGKPANGDYNFQFVLYDSLVGGSQVPGTPILTISPVKVTDGQFTVPLDFGNVFGDSKLFLEIGVRPAGSADSFTILSPRQELTPAPYARYAVIAGTAQSVDWANISNKPSNLSQRRIYIPGAAFGHPATANFAIDNWGLLVKNSAQSASFVVPRPIDWDDSTPFTVTLYFAVPYNLTDSVVNWRLSPGGSNINLGSDSADTGWDSLDYWAAVDGSPLTMYAAGGHFDLMKSQSWTTQWSSTYGTWGFGSSITSANSFNNGTNPIWHFSFTRGASVSNGETYTGDLVITGAEISYQAVP